MSAVAAYRGAAFAVLKRDFMIFISYRIRLYAQLMGVAVGVVLFYYVSRLVSNSRFPTPDDYFAFVVVGLVTLRALMSAFTTTSSTLRQELVAGTFERMATSPFGPVAGIASMLLFPYCLALFTSFATLAFAVVVFGLDLTWSTAPLALPVGILAAMAFAPFALMIASGTILFKQAAAGTGFLVTVISLVSGLWFPVELLPGWIQWVSDVQPFTPAVDLLRYVLVGTPLQHSAGLEVLKIAVFSVVLIPLSLWCLRGAIQLARRRATLIEY